MREVGVELDPARFGTRREFERRGARRSPVSTHCCEDPTGDPTKTAQAVDAFARARAITRAPGTVAQVTQLFDVLVAADHNDVLAGVRDTITGT